MVMFPLLCIAQENKNRNVKVETTEIIKENGKVILNVSLNLSDLELGSQEMMYLLPTLVSADNINKYEFDPVLIIGAKRNMALKRAINLGDFEFENEPQTIIRYRKHDDRLYPLTLSLDNGEWLQNADLVFYEDITGCRCRNEYTNKYTVMTLPAPYMPQYRYSYITPPVEEVKQRNENYSAYINYELAKHRILPDFKNNAEVLSEVDHIIKDIRNNTDLTVTDFTVIGYASPEGGFQYNMNLSKERAEAFVTYLKNQYNIPSTAIRAEWKGEDWEGLREVVSKSNLREKNEVMDIIDRESDRTVCENKLKQLSGGETYRTLLQEYYPVLRRNDYRISYVSRQFNVDEAKEIIKTRPHHLSQNEMYLVANTYPQNSSDFYHVLTVIEKYYPEDQVVLVNNSAYELENGNLEKAIQRLHKADCVEAWNNLGIAYCKKGDYRMAETYFRKAADSGSEIATHNATEFQKFLADAGITTE